MNAIEVHDLSKSYGKIKALNSLTFSIQEGTILGVIGPNGAGKTTLIRILSCLLKPDHGKVIIYGHEISSHCDDNIKKLFALLPQEARVHFYTLTPFEYIYHYLRMRGITKEEAKLRAEQAIKEFDIEYSNRIMSTLSGGMVRKTLLAMILSADAKIYYLDEPTVGLDVKNRLNLWKVLREKAKNSSIIMTSHYLNEISSVCDKVLLLKEGRIVAFGPPEEIGQQYLSDFYSKIVVFGEFSGEHLTKRAGKNTFIYVKSKSEEKEVINRLEELGLPFKREELTIEDIFLVGDLK
ncbi:daunorubicin resistance ATP-binding protein drrA [Pyrococcus sp. NA2]|nr:ABC transporter ATP-binding protein [Pyrococcus sp. NA2]AEC52790.1 daunorubicin resistance ATP-binding protein drrA [Pyrococcus sp. NA2]